MPSLDVSLGDRSYTLAIQEIETAIAPWKDLPLPSGSPAPHAGGLPLPASPAAVSPANLPLPAGSEEVAAALPLLVTFRDRLLRVFRRRRTSGPR